jgi:glucose/arabinose dehydrogenase
MKTKFKILIAVSIAVVLVMSYAAYVYLPKFVLKQKIDIGVGAEIGLEFVAGNLTAPVDIAYADNDSGRLFVADRTGKIKILDENGSLEEEMFLDMEDRLVELKTLYEERGLLGITFHPDYKNNGKFYVYYSAPLRENAPEDWDSTMTLSEFGVSENPNKADKNSERILLEIDKPALNHNGGTIAFGKDGYLYISVGDGGNANDAGDGHNSTIGNGQDPFTLLGKILRIDVNRQEDGKPYGIPKDNPFANGKNGLEEIYAYGLRNPWRMSFDYETERLFSGDAGQNSWEEISIIEKGRNYGWNLKEGTHCFSSTSPDKSPEECSDTGYKKEQLTGPVVEYLNSQQIGGLGHTTIGGFIYRGNAIPELYGKLVFGDWSTSAISPDGTLFIAAPSQNGLWDMQEMKIANRKNGKVGEFILSLGRDQKNELYVLATSDNSIKPAGSNGNIYKIVPGSQ